MKEIVTIAGQMEKVLAVRGWTAREWGRRAGLRGETHITGYMRRARLDPDATLGIQTVQKLAKAADITVDWLVLGEGIGPFVPDPVYPNRAKMLALAALAGFSRQAIDNVAVIAPALPDPDLVYWFQIVALEEVRTLAEE